MNKIKKSLLTIEQVSEYLDFFSISDIWNMIVTMMTFITTIILNIILFPVVLLRMWNDRS